MRWELLLTCLSRLILIESRIHRLSRYYKTVGVLPPTWRYESATASTMVA
jgi:small subunit ribosomal protein S13e